MEKTKSAVFEEIRRNVAGIDLAWRADHYVCGPRRESGECEIESFGTTTAELRRTLRRLKERGVESAAMESASVYLRYSVLKARLYSRARIRIVLDTVGGFA